MEAPKYLVMDVQPLQGITDDYMPKSWEIQVDVKEAMDYLWAFATDKLPARVHGWVSYAQEPFDNHAMLGKKMPKKHEEKARVIKLALEALRCKETTLSNGLDIAIRPIDEKRSFVVSHRMRCDYPVSDRNLLKSLVGLVKEYEDLVDA